MEVEKGVENVQNPVKRLFTTVDTKLSAPGLSNFCRKTAPSAPQNDGMPLAPEGKMRYNILGFLTKTRYNLWRFYPYAKEKRI